MHRNTPMHMNALEFIGSWEKKWQELNKLDFFVFQSINLLIENLSREFQQNISYDVDSIRSLAFLIGDKLENFISVNCFAKCPLNCLFSPDRVSDIKPLLKNEHLKKMAKDFPKLKLKDYQNHFWERDLSRYVVREVVLDYFRFNDNDFIVSTQQLIRQVIRIATKTILDFTYSPFGTELLQKNNQKADREFADVLRKEDFERFGKVDSRDNNQMDFLINDYYEQNEEWEELEEWQIPEFKMSDIIENYLLDFSNWNTFPGNHQLKEKRDHLYLFSNFLEDFSFITHIEEVDVALIHEFFYFYLPLYFELDNYGEIANIHKTMDHFFKWLTLKNINKKKVLTIALKKLTPFFERLVRISKAFYNTQVLNIFEGQDLLTTYQNFYQVVSRNQNTLILKAASLPFLIEVQIPGNTGLLFRKDDILDLVIAKNNDRKFSVWHLAHIYPGKAQMFIWGEIDENGESDGD